MPKFCADLRNADKIQPGYVIRVTDASPENAQNFLINVLLPEKSSDVLGVSKFYYIVTRLDLLGGSEGLGDPIATFNNPDDLLTFLRSAQNFGNYMVVTDGNTFIVYQRSLYTITPDQLDNPDVLPSVTTI